MAFGSVYAVDGSELTGPVLRAQLQSATRAGEGIIEYGDLRVRELAVPGTSVRVASGACVIRGKEVSFQGSYYGTNFGEETVTIPETGASARSDMIVAQVEDPTISGSPWSHDPATEPLIYIRVIPGVPSTATTIAETSQPGITAIPLARVDLPASTGTVEQEHIVDLRQMMDERSKVVMRVQRGVSPIDYAGNITSPDFENWPNLVWDDVDIPVWATQVQIDAVWGQTGFFPDDYSGSGSTDARGEARVSLGVTGNVVRSAWSSYNFNQLSPTNGIRVAIFNSDQVLIPAAMRGITTSLQMQVSGDPLAGGRLRADGASNYRVTLNFLERPVVDVDA
ncbi:hypothetical protein [Nocardiopsis sp. CA-288880]|uniref:hypothetical protein n=1 Tax=Nocardiopsis sp. CA-288880 TaxID=3239995 RepID=UPI003D97F02D